MAGIRKCFEDQNYLTLYMIQPLSGGKVGVGEKLGKRSWFSITRATGKVVGRSFFCPFCLFVIYSL